MTDIPECTIDPWEYDFGATGRDIVAEQLTCVIDGATETLTTSHTLHTPDESYMIDAFAAAVPAEDNSLVWLVLVRREDAGDTTLGISLPELADWVADGTMEIRDASEPQTDAL